jgi:hypothetical protein
MWPVQADHSAPSIVREPIVSIRRWYCVVTQQRDIFMETRESCDGVALRASHTDVEAVDHVNNTWVEIGSVEGFIDGHEVNEAA